MIGLLSNIPQQEKKSTLLKEKALVIAICPLIYYAIFTFLYPNGIERGWDRLALVAVAIIVACIQFTELPAKWRNYSIDFLIYALQTQLIWAASTNHFNVFYVLAIILSLQGLSASFYRLNSALVFIVVNMLSFTLLVCMDDVIDNQYKVLIIVAFVVTCLLNAMIAMMKSGYSQRKKMTQKLLQAIASRTGQAIFLTDFEGNIKEYNGRTSELFGYQPGELTGVNFSKLRLEELSEEEDAIGVMQLLEDKFWNAEKELVKKNGEVLMAHVSINWIKQKEQDFLVYRVSDISERKKNERDLIVAKEEAEQANKVKSEFLATMSHEIRTPLNGVIGMTQVLQSTALDHGQQDKVKTILSSGKHLLGIINNVLDFSKIESGKMQLEYRLFDLHELMEEVLKTLSPLADEKQIDMRLQIHSTVPRCIVGDSLRIKQVMMNLLSNAIKFTHKGFVTAKLTAQEDQKGLMLQFDVIDSGIGIPHSKLRMLFESFTQVDGSTTRKYGGTGLGLAISKQLAENMGGTLTVESRVNQGSTFTFTMLSKLNQESVENGLEKKKQEIKQHNDLSVLVAEDNLVNQSVIRLMLQRYGISPEIVDNGRDAVIKSKSQAYDLIFMDIQMPIMDGKAATRSILESPSTKGNPTIVAMTANVLDEDRAECKLAGMQHFIPKPIQVADLESVLAKISQMLMS